jgi:hypothetical protein
VRWREEELEWEGTPPTTTMRKGIRAHEAAHVGDVHGGAQATGAWPSSDCARVRLVTGHRLSGA